MSCHGNKLKIMTDYFYINHEDEDVIFFFNLQIVTIL